MTMRWTLGDGTTVEVSDGEVIASPSIKMLVNGLVGAESWVSSVRFPFARRSASLATEFDAIITVDFALGMLGLTVVDSPVPSAFAGREGDVDAPGRLADVSKAKFASKSEAAKFAAEQRWKGHQKKIPETKIAGTRITQEEYFDLVRQSVIKHGDLKRKNNDGSISDNEISILEAYKALKAYTFGGYRNMNAHLRREDEDEDRNDSFVGADKDGVSAAERLKKHWDDVALPLPENLVVFRGMIIDEDEKWVADDKWLEQGFMSTSANAGEAQKFLSDAEGGQRMVIMEITIPKGTMVIVPHETEFEHEEEVILKPGTTLKLTNVIDVPQLPREVGRVPSSSKWDAEVTK